MKLNTVKSSVILGMLLLGSVNLTFAQATDSSAKHARSESTRQ